MATFNIKFTKPDISAMKKVSKKRSAEIINAYQKESILAFAETAANKVPVDTGMTLESFNALLDKIGADNVIRVVKRKKYRPLKTISGTKHKDRFTGKEEGYAAGIHAYTIVRAKPNNLNFSFRYAVKVWQLDMFDGDWKVMSKAVDESRKYLRRNKRALEKKLGKTVYRSFGSFLR